MESAILGNGDKVDVNDVHFTDTQSKSAVVGHVSKVWDDQCISFAQGREKLAEDQQKIVDWAVPLSDWRPVVTAKNEFALQHRDTGREYVPTDHCLRQLAIVGDTSTWMLEDLRSDKESNKKNEDVKFHRDRSDAELMVKIVQHTLFNDKRMEQDKPRLFRTWADGTLRALLSSQYAIVNNDWFLSVLEDLIPGGRLSHWRGDADTVFGNVLIPDTIREESDSRYGGMLSIGNSEIGIRRIMSLPSVFRAICMNGCIWEQKEGDALRKVHRGKVDLSQLRYAIKTNLENQIPLLDAGIRGMLGTRGRGFGNVATVQMFCALAKQFGISRKEMSGVRKAFDVEVGILGKAANSCFGLIQSITRFGQTLPDTKWFEFDKLGGSLMSQTDVQWDAMRKLACTFTDDKDVEKLVGK